VETKNTRIEAREQNSREKEGGWKGNERKSQNTSPRKEGGGGEGVRITVSAYQKSLVGPCNPCHEEALEKEREKRP